MTATIFKVCLVTVVFFNTILFNQLRKWHYLLTINGAVGPSITSGMLKSDQFVEEFADFDDSKL